MTDYDTFLRAKIVRAPEHGFEVPQDMVNPRLLPHCRTIVPWLVRGGRRALFASFGLAKTSMQLDAVRLAAEHEGGRGLIVIPLGVRQEFRRDAVQILGWSEPPKFIRSIDEAGPTGVYRAMECGRRCAARRNRESGGLLPMSQREKIHHVRRAKQTRSHDCHWPGCGKQVPPAMWGCKRHWFILPATLRAKVWRAYQPGQEETLDVSEQYIAVAGEVQAWIAQQQRVSSP